MLSPRQCRIALAALLVGCGGARTEPIPPPANKGEPATSESTIAGTVTAPDGSPVADALVCLFSRATYDVAGHATTDPDGRWRVAVEPGRYRASVTAAGLTGILSDEFAHGEPVEGIDLLESPLALRLKPAADGGDVRGRFTLPESSPDALPLVKLNAGWSYRMEPLCARMSANGSFEARVPAGRYFIDVLSPDKHWHTDFRRYQVAVGRTTRFEQRLYHRKEMTAPASDAVIEGLRAFAVPIVSAAPGHSVDDLTGLDGVMRNARVVGLGEASHGAREFFQLKHRMFEYLVETHGFDVFAIEANFSESLAVNDYVLHGKGSAAEALSGMYFWVWDTEEVIALIEWMRAYNADPSHTHKLRFYGIDMQFTPAASRELRTYLRRVGSRSAETHEALWKALADEEWNRAYLRSDAAHAAEVRGVYDELVAEFSREEAPWTTATSARDYAFARQHLEILRQAERQFRPDAGMAYGARDEAMAANVMWLLEKEPPGTRIALWAHNRHLQEADSGILFTGAHLAHELGDAYVSVGFAFNQGAFQARDNTLPKPMGVTEVTLGEEPEGYIGHTLARVGPPIFALDLKTAITDPAVAEWFATPRFGRELGSVYTGEQGITYGLRHTDDFDVLVFVDTISRARPTETGKRGPGE